MGFNTAAFLLLIAAVVAIATRRLHLPYAAGLVAAGMGLAALPFAFGLGLTRELLFSVLLPPLIFEAAFHIPWLDLRRDLALIGVLATAGVLFSAGIMTAGMHYLLGWEWLSCIVFGVLLAATDPVSVIAIFRDAGARGRLLLLVESESLFNDGTAAVAFSVVLAFASGSGPSLGSIVPMAMVMIGGGVLCGTAVAGLAMLLAGRTLDHLVEITVTTVAAYGSFLLAEHFHLSGVLATLTAGLVLGNNSQGVLSPYGRDAVDAFWEYAAFVSNSLVFLLIGMRTASRGVLALWVAAGVAILMMTVGRAAAIYPCCLVFRRSSSRVPSSFQHVLFWGGLRGAMALALALGLPEQVPRREEIVTLSFAVVAFSIFVQGLTMRPLLRKLGEAPVAEAGGLKVVAATLSAVRRPPQRSR